MFDQYGNFISWVPKLIHTEGTIYKALINCIEKDIQEGILPGGFRMPPQRILANYLNINHSTVTKAYKICEERGLLKGSIGKGTYVNIYANIPKSILSTFERGSLIDFGMIHPVSEVNEGILSIVKEISATMSHSNILEYAPSEGLWHHRYIVSKWLEENRVHCPPDQIVITSGVQNALSLILAGFFSHGDRILVDELTYSGMINLAKTFGLILTPVPTTTEGIDVDVLERLCKLEFAKGLYLIPDCHNPTSAVIPLSHRKRIGELIEKHNLLFIEDDPYGRYNSNDLLPISHFAPEHSFLITGTSKVVSPSFRTGFCCAPKRCVNQLISTLNTLSWSASTINAEIITQLMLRRQYHCIAETKRSILKQRNTYLDNAQLKGAFIKTHDSSFIRYLTLPQHVSCTELENRCYSEGIQVFSSKRFHVGGETPHSGIRIAISGPLNNTNFEYGIEVLKRLIEQSVDTI